MAVVVDDGVVAGEVRVGGRAGRTNKMAAAQARVCCPSRLEHSAGSEQEGSGAAAVPGDQLADGAGGRPLAVAQDGGVVGGEVTVVGG